LQCSRAPENYTGQLIHCVSKETFVKRHSLFMVFFVIFVFSAELFAGDSLTGLKPDQFTLSGYGSFVNTRIVKFYNAGQERPPT
jgi:hypothetical protein